MSAAVPAMDSPSVAFAWFLETMKIETELDTGLVMACALCNNSVCDIEAGDDLRVLLNTGLQHTCPKGKK